MDRQNAPSVWIVILAWNHWELTAACLATLKLLDYPHYQILVVDNSSTDGTVERIREQYPEVELIENKINVGFAAGCNQGLNYALSRQADYIFLLNNDTLVPTEALSQLMAIAEELPDAGLIAPQLRYAKEQQEVWFTASRRHPWTLEARDFGPEGPRRHMNRTSPQVVDYLFGTALLIPAQALRVVGGFDEAFFMYYEDMDLCIRLQAAGFALYYVSTVYLYHHVAGSTGQYSLARYQYQARSSVIFFRKHTRGWRWLFVLPARAMSALRTSVRLIRHRRREVLQAYWCGIVEGLRYSPTVCSVPYFP